MGDMDETMLEIEGLPSAHRPRLRRVVAALPPITPECAVAGLIATLGGPSASVPWRSRQWTLGLGWNVHPVANTTARCIIR